MQLHIQQAPAGVAYLLTNYPSDTCVNLLPALIASELHEFCQEFPHCYGRVSTLLNRVCGPQLPMTWICKSCQLTKMTLILSTKSHFTSWKCRMDPDRKPEGNLCAIKIEILTFRYTMPMVFFLPVVKEPRICKSCQLTKLTLIQSRLIILWCLKG